MKPTTTFMPLNRSTGDTRLSWNMLAYKQIDSAPFTDEAWLDAYQEVHPKAEIIACVASENASVVGFAPLMRTHESWSGRSLHILRSPTFDWLSRYEFIAESGRPEILDILWRSWLTDSDCEIVSLELVPENSPSLGSAHRVAGELGWKVSDEAGYRSPWKTLPSAPEKWDVGLKSKFKSNLRNRTRRLEKLGTVTYEVVRSNGRLSEAMEIFYDLEAAGWKSELGTSIKDRPHVKDFYDRLVQRAAEDIWVPILSLDGRPVAAQFIRVCGNSLYLFKVGYDPEFHTYSPGQLITARSMAYAAEHGIHRFDFLGEEMTWKMDWNPQLLGHRHLTLYAPTATGRYLYWTQHGLRSKLKRIPGLAVLARYIKSQGSQA